MSTHRLIRSETIGDVLILELGESVGNMSDYSLLNEFEEVRSVRRETGTTKIIFDLAHAQFFGSSLLELVRVLWNDIHPLGGRLVICNPSTFGREVLEIAKFDQLWPLVETRQHALDLLSISPEMSSWPKSLQETIARYDDGPRSLREAVQGMTSAQLRTPAPPGVWSVLQVVCHLADFEIVYADRMKRIIAEERPTLFGGDPDDFAAKLAYMQRDLNEELAVIEAIRRSTSRFLKTLRAEDFDRVGVHSDDGPLTLTQFLERISGHIPHHVRLIEGKKQTFAEQ